MKTPRALVVAVVVATGLAGAGCRGHSVAPGEARLVPSGRVDVQRTGHAFAPVSHATTLHRGDQVRVTTGSARMELAGRRSIELRDGSQVALGASPELISADALVTALGSRLTVVVGGTNVVLTDGAARLANRNGAVVVGVYRGLVDVDSAGRRLDGGVPALRQVTIAAPGLLQDRPSPLDYDETHPDPWDLRFLSDAISLGAALSSRSRAVTASTTPRDGTTPGFYRQLVPDLARQSLLDQNIVDQLRANGQRPTGETLVGLAITAAGTRGQFVDRVQSVFGFRDQGARWGLVALDQGVDRVGVLDAVDRALGTLAPSSLIGVASGRASGPSPTTAPTESPGPTTPAPPSTRPSPPPTSPPTTKPVIPPPPPTGTPADPVAKSLVDTINGLLGPILPPRR
ncbi:MAG: hypothetical protein JWO37_1254 [Acidimicrobiales bacterium]|nr:hypothetical protein [Acidimicrobiales bacterium]